MKSQNVTVFDLSVFKSVVAVPTLLTFLVSVKKLYPEVNMETLYILTPITILVAGIVIVYNKLQLLNSELNLWCTNLEPEHYPMKNTLAGYLFKAKGRYRKWLRRNLFIPSSKKREEMFYQLANEIKNKPGVVKIQEGLSSIKKKP